VRQRLRSHNPTHVYRPFIRHPNRLQQIPELAIHACTIAVVEGVLGDGGEEGIDGGWLRRHIHSLIIRSNSRSASSRLAPVASIIQMDGPALVIAATGRKATKRSEGRTAR